VENALNHAVCDGRVRLAAAQNAIAADWLTAETRLGIGRHKGGGAWCRAIAAYSAKYNDYDVYVHSNQPDRLATAIASNGAKHSYYTDDTGFADIYLYANAGDTGNVTVGKASCSTTT
jgi:hypothetical protein